MKNLNKVCSVLLAVFMLLSMIPMQLFAASVENPWENGTRTDNVFLDALAYLGYETTRFTKHNEVGNDVSSNYRTNIGYNTGGATGLETTSAGKPNVATFKSKGLCCGSYSAYVYFNYLPNVAGVDTSFLTCPSNPRSTTSWHTAAESWVSAGTARKTSFNVSCDSTSGLSKLKSLPIGSLLIFKDSSGNYLHTGIYAGYRSTGSYTYYYQTQVGNSRGPEACLINNYNKSGKIATLEAAYTPIVPEATGRVGMLKVDDAGNAVSGAKIGVYSNSACTNLLTTLTTNSDGRAVYADYLEAGTKVYFKELTAPTGYDKSTQIVSATVVADKTTYASTKIVDNRQGKITATKYDDAGTKLGAGYVFGVYSDKACTKGVTTMTTGANSVATTGYLSAGTYYVKEKSLPSTDKTHKLNSTVYTVKVTYGGTVAVNSGRFVNDRMKGNATVTKTSEDGVVEGVQFRLHGTADIGTAVDVTAKTNSKGIATFSNVLIGTYTVEELNVPGRYETPKSKTVTVKDGQTANVTFKNILKRSDLTITKTAEDGVVSNVEFKLTGTTLTGEKISLTAKTDKSGIAKFPNLLPSDSNGYTLSEVNTPDWYIPVNSEVIYLANGVDAETSVHNALKKGSVKVTKTAEDGLVEGITFRLTGTSMSGAKIDMTAVTNKDGVAMFNNVLISGSTPYTVEEVDTAIKYVIPANQTKAVEWNKVTEVSFNNVLKKFSVEVTKTDRETGTAQGDASLAGAVYGIYKGGKLIDKYTTDANGKFTTSEYICGDDWTIKEIAPSEGYLLDDTVYSVGASAKLYTLENNKTSNTVTEQVIKGRIHLTKLAVKDKNEVGQPETGAVFSVRLKSTNTLVATLTIGEDGTATSPLLPYGVYTVHQEKGWEGYKNVADFDVYISENSKTYSFILNDYIYSSYIKVVKQDAETGKNIAYAGAGFQIYDADGKLVTMEVTYPDREVIDTFYTDSNGVLITPFELNYGKYSLVEVKAPHGYILDKTAVSFEVKPSTIITEDGLPVVKVTKSDYAQKGKITVTKEGEVFWNATQTDSGYELSYKAQGLAGAVYEIYAADDIITTDGTIRVKKGTLVDTITTGKDGKATSKALYLGKYNVIEVKAPEGYVINKTPHEVELVYGAQTESIVSAGTTFLNERQKVEISLTKTMEQNADFNIGNNGEIENVRFGLYANENIKAADGTILPKDALIEEVQVDKNGTVKFSKDLPFGQYYVKEIATDEHYVLNGTKYLVTFSYAGQDKDKVILTVNNGNIENKLKYGSVEGLKVDEFGKPVQGAEIGLFVSTDATEPVYTAVSDSNGKFRFDNVPYGTWYVKEIKAPTGFLLNETVFPVTIKNDGDIAKVTIENTYIRGKITLTKVDKDYPENKLTGAVFTVYDSSNKKVGELKETSAGVYESDALIYGKYFVKETKAPTGFLLDTNTYSVFIETDGAVYTINNDTSGCFINAPALGSLKIVKSSEDGIVEGFKFRVYGTDITGHYYDETFVTDENGEILIENLRIGTYTVTELDVADRYITPADVTVSVETGNTAVVNVNNALKRGSVKVTKTAEDGLVEGVKFHLYGTSLSGIAVDEYAITDENGIAVFNDILISDENGYVIEEVETADRYRVPAEQTVVVEWETVADVEFYNELKHGNISLTKVDVDIQDKLLSGAVFEVFYDVNENGIYEADIDILVGEMTERETGIYQIDNVRYGGYFIHEKVAPAHYNADGGYYYVEVKVDGETVIAENVEGTGLFVNGIKFGNILIVKSSEDGKVEGFSFRVIGNGIDMIVKTDAKGEALIENLRVDSEYTIEEVEDEVSKGYIRPKKVTVGLIDGETLIVNLYNELEHVDIPNTDYNNTAMFSLAVLIFALVFVIIFMLIPSKKKKDGNNKN